MKWAKETLGSLCEITSSKRIFYSEYVESGVPFYRSKEIIEKAQGQEISEPLFISEEKFEEIKERFGTPNVGDMLLTSVGTIGVAYIVKDYDYFYFKDGNLTWFRNFGESLLPKYLYYWISSSEGLSILNNTTIGSSQKALTINALKSIKIPLPPVKIQKKIIDVLSAYDDLIENNQKQIKLLEEAAQRLYKEWFVDLRFPGYETTPILDGIPQGWENRKLSDVFDYVRGRSYNSNELSETSGNLMVNLKNIRPFGGYNRNAEKRYLGQYKENQTLLAGDIVMGVTDMTQERRLVGHVAIIPEFCEHATFTMDLIKLIPKQVSKNYLYAALFFGGYSKKISPLANGTNVLHLKPEVMMNLEMLVPTEGIIQKFDLFFEPIRKSIDILENQCNKAKEARDRLLPKLMNGGNKINHLIKETNN